MNEKELISVKMIEAYCLGKTSEDESAYIEGMALLYPQIQQSIAKMKKALLMESFQAIIPPNPAVKFSLMRKIYKQQAALDKKFIPLMDDYQDFNDFYESANANFIQGPGEGFENLFALPLPSTREVINMAVWVKKNHEEEVHTHVKEFIAILHGSCDMYIDGVKKGYKAGQVVTIPINVPHYGIVTSANPMFALVQRQAI